MWYCFIRGVNQAAKHFSVKGYKPIFSYFEGAITLVAEAAEFTGAKLPPNYHYVGPLMSRQDYPLPDEIRDISRDLPLVYFAMGSSGTYKVVSDIVRSFEGQPYRVIAPVKFILDKRSSDQSSEQRHRNRLAASDEGQQNGRRFRHPWWRRYDYDRRLCWKTNRRHRHAARASSQYRMSGTQRNRCESSKISKTWSQGSRSHQPSPRQR